MKSACLHVGKQHFSEPLLACQGEKVVVKPAGEMTVVSKAKSTINMACFRMNESHCVVGSKKVPHFVDDAVAWPLISQHIGTA